MKKYKDWNQHHEAEVEFEEKPQAFINPDIAVPKETEHPTEAEHSEEAECTTEAKHRMKAEHQLWDLYAITPPRVTIGTNEITSILQAHVTFCDV